MIMGYLGHGEETSFFYQAKDLYHCAVLGRPGGDLHKTICEVLGGKLDTRLTFQEQIDFYLTQFLGHDCFGGYLHRMGKVTSPEFQYGL